MGTDERWLRLDEPWRECLRLAWEAYRAGTIPVGAVVVDGAGRIVGRGRNRIFAEPDGGLAGTRLAHAEVDALRALPAGPRYRDHVVYSALEPCLLCVGAVLVSEVGGIRYLAVDPVGGACRGRIDVPHARREPLEIEGPFEGWPERLATALSIAFWLGHPEAAKVVSLWTGGSRAAGERIRAFPNPPAALEEALADLLACLI
jgi:tRNA(adenine34) deaminase